MQGVGEVLHLASSGRVIIRLTTTVHDGQLLVDEAGRKIAKVSEMIGPADAPYASATPLTNNIQKYIGKKIFMERESPAVRPKRFRGRNK